MGAFKDIIRTLFVKMDEMEPIVSEKDFKKYVGVSKDKFENKLGKIDVALDKHSYKGNWWVFNDEDQGSSKHKTTPRKPFAFWNDFNEKPVVTDGLEVYLSKKDVCDDIITGLYSGRFVIDDLEAHLFDEYYTAFAQAEFDYVLSLQDQYGEHWYEVYKYFKEMRRTYNVLLELERHLLKEQQELFSSSSTRLFRFEYYDLMFTVKKWAASDQVSFGSYPFCSYKTLNHNEIKGIKNAA